MGEVMGLTLVRTLSLLSVALVALPAQEGKSRAVEHTLPKYDASPYFVVPARKKAKKQSLLVVMPGGPGTRDFLPWVENGILGTAPDDCVGVMVTAAKWRKDQKIVWPTRTGKVRGMRFTTEDYVRAVVAAVRKSHNIASDRIALLSWSSSGPASYLLLTDKKSPFTHGYVAMSVWRALPKKALKGALGRRFVLDQSPDDETTTFPHVRRAFAALDGAGAQVMLSTYDGGHGWQDGPIPRLRRNLKWLFGKAPAPKPQWPDDGGGAPAKAGDNLLRNPGFERGPKSGWRAINNSGRLVVAVDKDKPKEGKQSLHVLKTGRVPLDLLLQEVTLPKGATGDVALAMQVKTDGVRNAWLKLWLYDDKDQVVNKDDVNVARLQGTKGWQRYTKQVKRGAAVRAVVQVIMVMGGEVWLDDAKLTAAAK